MVNPMPAAIQVPNFDSAPITVAWELTRACAYSCAHCRADAQPRRHPDELDTAEACDLVDRLAGFSNRPILVLTGGDPLMRKDVFEIAAHAADRGLRVALTPTATGLSTPTRMREAREAGVGTVAFSLDAPEAAPHDAFRRTAGSFGRTVRGIEAACEAGLPLQINTTVYALNEEAIERMPALVAELGAMRWAVFFLIPVGRGRSLKPLSAERQEALIERLLDLAPEFPFDLKLTAAPQFRRIALDRAPSPSGAGGHPGPRRPQAPTAVSDGRGFMFISHRGEVMPSGFLPLSAGNVRDADPVAIYRNSALFCRLRDPDRLTGKCGVCEFRRLCGGSRARAYAASGDPMSSDPGCPYIPHRAVEPHAAEVPC